MSDWQTMDTAPKDGTSFQAWVVRNDTGFGSWEPYARFNPDSEAFEIWGRTDYDQDGWDVYMHVHPTHWMPAPLPPPPGDGQ